VASAEVDGYAGLSGKSFRFSVITFFLIQKKKDPVVILKRSFSKLFSGDPDSDLSHKNQRFLLIFYQLPDRIFKIQISFRMEGIPKLFQTMVDLSGDQFQFKLSGSIIAISGIRVRIFGD
jgi:hypothetical protein